jgi:xanthine dehydrogenase accessory factor
MDYDLLIKAVEAAQGGRRYAVATVVESTLKGTPRKSGAKMIVFEDGSACGSIGGGRNEKAAQAQCLKAIKSGKPRIVSYDYFGNKGESICGGQINVFIEPFEGRKNLVICGAGHIGLPLSLVGKMLGYKVTVIDHRKAFASKKRFPHADRIVAGKYAPYLRKMSADLNTFIMIVTPGNEYDFECLRTVVCKDAAYVGVISSKAKRIRFLNRLRAVGVSQKYLNRVRIPAGIDIGAQTPEEIAVSIAAELVKINNKDFLNTDKFKEKG